MIHISQWVKMFQAESTDSGHEKSIGVSEHIMHVLQHAHKKGVLNWIYKPSPQSWGWANKDFHDGMTIHQKKTCKSHGNLTIMVYFMYWVWSHVYHDNIYIYVNTIMHTIYTHHGVS